jgi:hypothetical protein
MVWLFSMEFYFGHFYLKGPLPRKMTIFFSYRIWTNHTPIDRSCQTEKDCAVQVVLLTHFGMI